VTGHVARGMKNIMLGLAALLLTTFACSNDPWLDDMESRARDGDQAAANTVEAVQRGLISSCIAGTPPPGQARFYSGADWNYNCMQFSGEVSYTEPASWVMYWPGTGTKISDVPPRSFVSRAKTGATGSSAWIFTDLANFQMHQAPGGYPQPSIWGVNCNGATTYGVIPYQFNGQADPFWSLVSLWWAASDTGC
jgi:hypothetical protein